LHSGLVAQSTFARADALADGADAGVGSVPLAEADGAGRDSQAPRTKTQMRVALQLIPRWYPIARLDAIAGGARISGLRHRHRPLALDGGRARAPIERPVYIQSEVHVRAVRISEDIVPVSDFKAQAANWSKRVADTGQPVVITQNGKAAAVLVSPSEFDRLCERAGLLEAIDAGLADEKAGRVVSHGAVVAEMKRRAARRTSKR
jgi:prevent-host-death family protein